MAEGHPEAMKYPLSKLWIEVELAQERVNGRIATEATLMQAVVAMAVNPKRGSKVFEELMRDLTDG